MNKDAIYEKASAIAQRVVVIYEQRLDHTLSDPSINLAEAIAQAMLEKRPEVNQELERSFANALFDAFIIFDGLKNALPTSEDYRERFADSMVKIGTLRDVLRLMFE